MVNVIGRIFRGAQSLLTSFSNSKLQSGKFSHHVRHVAHRSKEAVVAMVVTLGGQFFMILVAIIAVSMLVFVTIHAQKALELILSDTTLTPSVRGITLIQGIKTVTETIFPVFSVVLIVLSTAFAGIWYVKRNIQMVADELAGTQPTPPPASPETNPEQGVRQ